MNVGIVPGASMNIQEAMISIQYIHMYICMLTSLEAYGVSNEERRRDSWEPILIIVFQN